MHHREKYVSLMKKNYIFNAGAKPGLKKPGGQSRKKNTGTEPRVNRLSLNDIGSNQYVR